MENIKIESFRGYNGFLSNMYPSPITLGGVHYTCAEAAFQAVKLADKSARKMFEGLTGSEAKKLGRKIQLRPDWESIKINVMRWIISEKFKQNPELRMKLYRTRNFELIEGNTWGDTFWGVCNGKGRNWLGRILMEYRDENPIVRRYNESDYPEIINFEETDDVPEAVAKFNKHVMFEESDAGYERKECQFYKGNGFYAIDVLTMNPIGEYDITAFFVMPDGEEFAQIENFKIEV